MSEKKLGTWNGWTLTATGYRYRFRGVTVEQQPHAEDGKMVNPICLDLRAVACVTAAELSEGVWGSAFWSNFRTGDFFALHVPYEEAREMWLAANGLVEN